MCLEGGGGGGVGDKLICYEVMLPTCDDFINCHMIGGGHDRRGRGSIAAVSRS